MAKTGRPKKSKEEKLSAHRVGVCLTEAQIEALRELSNGRALSEVAREIIDARVSDKK